MKTIWRGCLVVFFALTANAAVAHAETAIFKELGGSWRGSGDLTLSDGSRERISCRGYYVPKGGDDLSLAILCNSPNYKLEIRSNLAGHGSSVSGHWEERTFNARGELSGRATGNGLKLSITGYITGSMSVSLSGSHQSVSISAHGTGFKTVSMSLVR